MNKSKLEKIAIVLFFIIIITIGLYFYFEKENIQDKIFIDYTTGESKLKEEDKN